MLALWNWKRAIRPLLRTLLNWYVRPRPVSLSFEYETGALGLLSRVKRIGPIDSGFCVERSDWLVPGLQHRHAFADRQLFLLKKAFFSAKTGQIYLRRHPVRESRPEVTPGFLGPVVIAKKVRRRNSETAIAISRSPWNYYHWLLEDLPAILRAQEVEPRVQVFLGNRPPKFVRESLELLGIQFEVTNVNLVFEELLLPTRGEDAKWHREQDLDRIRTAFSAHISEPLGRKLYVSRRHSSRGFANEEMLEDFLSLSGFEVIYAEQLSVMEQVKIFSEANVVVGNHGAGLSNIVFGPRRQLVVELTSRHNMNDCFRGLARCQGKPFHRIITIPGKRMDQSEVASPAFSEIAARVAQHEEFLLSLD